MTVLCIAMGTPLPTVTLYINGFPLRSEVRVQRSIPPRIIIESKSRVLVPGDPAHGDDGAQRDDGHGSRVVLR